MKTWFKNFPLIYMVVSLVMGALGWLTNLIPALEGQVLLVEVFFGSLIVTLLIHTAIKVYQLKWGSGIISIFLALLIVLPIAPMMRRIYFPLVSRIVGFVYLLILIYLVVFTIVIAYQHAKNKKDSDDLNALLTKKKKKKD